MGKEKAKGYNEATKGSGGVFPHKRIKEKSEKVLFKVTLKHLKCANNGKYHKIAV